MKILKKENTGLFASVTYCGKTVLRHNVKFNII